MAFPAALLLLLVSTVHVVTALQVTPNSPCASVCLGDSAGLDKSDPNSFTTTADDIVCLDDEFTSVKKGETFQACLSCLQESTFSQGTNNDLNWFLYNLRYSFDVCIFGYPNSTGEGSNPCATSEACGRLDKALEGGILDPFHTDQYAYCDADGGIMLSEDDYDSCLGCVQADQTHFYLSNFLIALEAGCQQQPTSGARLGLNDTVFTRSAIAIVDPATLSGQTNPNGVQLPVTAIVGISIGGFVLILLAAGCIYMQYRRRKNRARRERRMSKHARSSAWSFRCQTHLTPKTPSFGAGAGGNESEVSSFEEKVYMDPSAALSSNPVSEAVQAKYGGTKNQRLTTITTTSLPQQPRAIRTSPQRNSPGTPTSSTSTRSNAPLLYSHKPYMPSYQTQTSSPQPSNHAFMPGLAISTPQDTSVAMNYSDYGSSRGEVPSIRTASRREFKKIGPGAPVELQNIQTSFPPPPMR